MGEKLSVNAETDGGPSNDTLKEQGKAALELSDFDGPAFPEDPRQYTEEELMADPVKRYHVNPEDFPFFSRQKELGPNKGDPEVFLPLDETMGRFVTSTADTIAVIAGEDKGLGGEKLPAADHVIYLDKSARPVSWLVNVFWDDFTEKKRPEHSYLAIDRKEWYNHTGTNLEGNEYVLDPNGETVHIATFERDFKKENVTREDLARIRALYIPGGIENEDVEEIMNTPTGLAGKNITIIDEVSRSESTAKIAQFLVSQAIPEAASVNYYIFWKPGTRPAENGERQMLGTPVWYNSESSAGRGIGDISEPSYQKRYKDNPNSKTRAQRFGSFVLGAFMDLLKEEKRVHHFSSRQLAREIKTIHREWDAGHIFMPMPSHYDEELWIENLEKQGVKFVPQEKGKKPLKNSYIGIKQEINNRTPAV